MSQKWKVKKDKTPDIERANCPNCGAEFYVSDSVDEYICLKCKATLIKDKKKNYP
jgi:ribosomal protein S27AE